MTNGQTKIKITIDNDVMIATLADNIATEALTEKLNAGPITITMDNYGGFEKVGALPWSLPSSDTRISTEPGDIMLYTGNNIVIFYGENTWSYTPLGKLETTSPAEISAFVGTGRKDVTIALYDFAGSQFIERDAISSQEVVYSLNGKLVTQRPLKAGFYIVNDQKVMIK